MDEVEEEESVQDRYSRMSRHEKLALLMIALGPHASSTLLKGFDPKDSDSICKKIGDFPIVGQDLKDCVLDEFSEIIESSVNSNLGGFEFAKHTLELAHGGFKANNIMNRIAPVAILLISWKISKRWTQGRFIMCCVLSNLKP